MNGRPVADPVLKTAVRVAYREVIAVGRHPVVALYLDAAGGGTGRQRASRQDRTAVPRPRRGAIVGDRRLGRALGGGVGSAVPAPRPSLHLVHSRPACGAAAPYRFPGFAEAQLPVAASPAARILPAADPPDHPLGAPVAQVLDTYVIAVACRWRVGTGRSARRA